MELFRRFREKFHDDWCGQCTQVMEVRRKQLYAMPEQLVGHYVSHTDPEYYKTHLTPVSRKSDIPIGMYACGLILYRCPNCGFTAVKVCVFLPVRGEEKLEEQLYFDKGELDDFVRQTALEPSDPPQPRAPGELNERKAIRDIYHYT